MRIPPQHRLCPPLLRLPCSYSRDLLSCSMLIRSCDRAVRAAGRGGLDRGRVGQRGDEDKAEAEARELALAVVLAVAAVRAGAARKAGRRRRGPVCIAILWADRRRDAGPYPPSRISHSNCSSDELVLQLPVGITSKRYRYRYRYLGVRIRKK